MSNKIKWRFINESVQGASHIRKNVPCQDYSLCVSGENGDGPVILTASDGHGGHRHFRSAQGAVFACESAVSIVNNYITVLCGEDTNIVKQITETRLKLEIVKSWHLKTLEHALRHPFTEEELEITGLTSRQFDDILKSQDITEKEPVLSAYGATLLVAAILDDKIICEQIGDGDILFFNNFSENQKNNKIYSPIERDESLFANETTSLCSLKAPFYFRHSVTYLYDKGNLPDLIMLATDGYSNSFSNSEDYHKTAEDYYNLLKDEGEQFVLSNIPSWLKETSAKGSGDDITIVLAYSRNVENL